ncbi:sensor histidine kinase [Nocardioides sp. GXZ039]|uniref:sensor histidine kinase n=1 Tax=Nocardioides sp. GXZ039 TaxID=3136018 RepID=UPI0030F3CCC7
MSNSTGEPRRLADIAQYDVIGRRSRRDLTAIVELAAKICGTAMASVNLITDAQHQVATYGFDPATCSLADSICAQYLERPTPMVVPDVHADPRFADHPSVTGDGPEIHFYASHQLVTPAGVVVGTLCVYDPVARTLDQTQIEALSTLADRVIDALELSVRNRQLAASNDRLMSFAGRVSHDLKTPLTSLSLSLDMLREQIADGEDPAELTWLLDRAVQGSRRMASMIDDLLAYARLGGQPATGPVDLDGILTEALADQSEAYLDADVRREPLPTITGDTAQLRALLQNVLDNAAKYRHPDRRLALVVSARQTDRGWQISVADNGIGIQAPDRERVFAPRVRLSTEGTGSGIGLDTCRRVVQAHGGAIWITETDGGGTTVWFDLPR